MRTQELESLHNDARTQASSLIELCSNLKAAADVSEAARTEQMQQLVEQWQTRLAHNDSEHRSAINALTKQLTEMGLQLKDASAQLAEARLATTKAQEAQDIERQNLERQLATAQQELQDGIASGKKAAKLVQTQDQELRVLHEQVCPAWQSLQSRVGSWVPEPV